MNIEHEYYDLTGSYEPFEGICLVDTFELAEDKQISLFTTENTQRVNRQRNTPIYVIIGNPPYNAGQINENDNNKNRKYPTIDSRVSETYGKDSTATLVRKLNDPYVKAIRWASDRIGDEGIVVFVTNDSFVNEITYDGMRKHLERDFDVIYILDLGGNIRKNPKLSGTTHNVFGIQIGVSINLFVRKKSSLNRVTKIYYQSVDEYWRKGQKYEFLDMKKFYKNVEWKNINPDKKNHWLREGISDEFGTFAPIGEKEGKSSIKFNHEAIFKNFSLGVCTNRDEWMYDFQGDKLEKKVKTLIQNYNLEVSRFLHEDKTKNVDDFVNNDPKFIKWTDRLKISLQHGERLIYDQGKIRNSLYRPFTKKFLYFDHLLNQRRYRQQIIFPTIEVENKIICVPGIGNRKEFGCLAIDHIAALDFAFEKAQCFPFYTYNEDGSNRRENITDWALEQFRAHYDDTNISKWDIFHYVYAVLHHPQYREKYAANLKRELPRIPFTPDFWGFVEAGKQLGQIHVHYEAQEEYPLETIETPGMPLNWRVEKMRLSKDKTQIVYNDFLTLAGIPAETFEYRLGNRSALDWVIDQYQVNVDKRSGIVNDANRSDDPAYIVRLIGKVITVSLETMKIVKGLPLLD